jgi:hypothetical protein
VFGEETAQLAGEPHRERKALPVRAGGQKHRVRLIVIGAEDVGGKRDTVIHRDSHVPVDAHAVP